MQMDNPYSAPTTAASYLDPRLHSNVQLNYMLTEKDLQVAVKRYLADEPYLVLSFLASFLLPGLVLAFLEEAFGFVPSIPFWIAVSMWIGFAYSVRYLVSLPIRLRVERNLRDDVLGIGWKSVCFYPESVEVDSGQERVEFDLRDVAMRGSTKHHYLIFVLEPNRILAVPYHAFDTHMYFAKFEKLMKKRLRSQRDFWSFKL